MTVTTVPSVDWFQSSVPNFATNALKSAWAALSANAFWTAVTADDKSVNFLSVDFKYPSSATLPSNVVAKYESTASDTVDSYLATTLDMNLQHLIQFDRQLLF